MKQTGDYWLLAVTTSWNDQTHYIILNYVDNSCSYWSDSLNFLNLTFESIDKPIPSMAELAEHYTHNFLYMLPLESPISILSQYPELFL